MSVPPPSHQVLPRERSSPRHVREIVAQVLGEAGLDEGRVRLAQLLASELATNAVRHGSGGSFSVEVAAHEGVATVRVRDEDPRPPLPRPPSEEELQQGGWGLALVDRLSRAWGFEPSGSGKVVWFSLGPDDR